MLSKCLTVVGLSALVQGQINTSDSPLKRLHRRLGSREDVEPVESHFSENKDKNFADVHEIHVVNKIKENENKMWRIRGQAFRTQANRRQRVNERRNDKMCAEVRRRHAEKFAKTTPKDEGSESKILSKFETDCRFSRLAGTSTAKELLEVKDFGKPFDAKQASKKTIERYVRDIERDPYTRGELNSGNIEGGVWNSSFDKGMKRLEKLAEEEKQFSEKIEALQAKKVESKNELKEFVADFFKTKSAHSNDMVLKKKRENKKSFQCYKKIIKYIDDEAKSNVVKDALEEIYPKQMTLLKASKTKEIKNARRYLRNKIDAIMAKRTSFMKIVKKIKDANRDLETKRTTKIELAQRMTSQGAEVPEYLS